MIAMRNFCARVRRVFAGLSVREKILSAAIAGTALAFWAASILRGVSEVRTRLAGDDSAKLAQDAWLTTAPFLEKTLAAKAAGLDASRRLDAETVMARLEKLLAKAGLNAETARPLTHDTGVGRTHLVTLRCEAATLEQLVAFRRALDASGLPMAVTAMEMESGGDGSTLRARLDITALELK